MLLSAALIIGIVSCRGKGEAQTKLSPEEIQLVKRYQEMKMAGIRNQRSKFMHMRDSVTRMEVANYFRRTGRIIDSTTIYHWAFNWPDVAGQPLVQDSTNGRWRRLIFRQCGLINAVGIEDCVYSVVMFGKDRDEWNISNAYRIGGHRYNDDGSEFSVADLRFNEMFRLPPSFEPLYKQQPGDSTATPTFRPLDSSAVERKSGATDSQ